MKKEETTTMADSKTRPSEKIGSGRYSRIRSSEKKRRSTSRSKDRYRRTIYIGEAFDRWEKVRITTNCDSHDEFASLLLNTFATRLIHVATQSSGSGPNILMSTPVAGASGLHILEELPLSSVGEESDKSSDPRMSGIEEIGSQSKPKPKDMNVGLSKQERLTTVQQLPISPAVPADDLMLSINFESDSDDVYDPDDPSYYPSLADISICNPLSEDDSLEAQEPLDDVYNADLGELCTGEDVEDDASQLSKTVDDLSITASGDELKEPAFIAHQSCLIKLSMANIPRSCRLKKCSASVKEFPTRKGTALLIKWVCNNGHVVSKWASQPIIKEESKNMPLGNLLISSAITMSGNNYTKVALMFKFANVGIVSSSSFHRIQSRCVVPAVSQYWEDMKIDGIQQLKDKDVIIAGDGRMDSPGFCAKYCTYSSMELESGRIVDVQVVDKRETGLKSTNMEVLAFQRMMEEMKKSGIAVREVITDAHPSVTCKMRNDYPTALHSYDVWHGAKNLGKKLAMVSLQKGCKELKPWVRDITNHFWYCSKACSGDETMILNKWRGVLHHVADEHSWATGACEHALLTDAEKPWIVSGTPAHDALANVVLGTRFLNTLKFYTQFRSTAQLESFQNHILAYASKRFAYSYAGYKARCLLAAIDYNEHLNRQPLLTESGDVRQARIWSKHANHWTVKTIKEAKQFLYIPQLMNIIYCTLITSVPLRHSVEMSADDPRHIASTIAAVPPKSTTEIATEKQSRFKRT